MAGSIANSVFVTSDDLGHAACSLSLDWRGLVLRELGEGAARSGLVVVVQEILLVFAPVGRAVASEQRGGAGAVVGNEPLANFGECGVGRFLRSEDLLEHPSRLEGQHEGAGAAALPHHMRRRLHTTKIGSPANENSHIG